MARAVQRGQGGTILLVAGAALLALGGGAYLLRPAPQATPPALPAGGLAALPESQFTLADGAGRDLTQSYCTMCHSLAPIVRHNGFTAEVWAKEVTKMRQQYGAPIDDATAKTITTYLQQNYVSGGQP